MKYKLEIMINKCCWAIRVLRGLGAVICLVLSDLNVITVVLDSSASYNTVVMTVLSIYVKCVYLYVQFVRLDSLDSDFVQLIINYFKYVTKYFPGAVNQYKIVSYRPNHRIIFFILWTSCFNSDNCFSPCKPQRFSNDSKI